MLHRLWQRCQLNTFELLIAASFIAWVVHLVTR
jgi:hypothetical protein